MARGIIRLVGVVVIVMGLAGATQAQAPPARVDAPGVYTICTLLVGQAAGGGQAQGATPLALVGSSLSTLEAAQYAENLADLSEKLKSAFRLDRVDVVGSYGDWVAPGREMVLEDGQARLVVRADGVTSAGTTNAVGAGSLSTRAGTRAAQFALQLNAGATVILDRPWSVTLGTRSVLARQAEANGPLYVVVIATPVPGIPMVTSIGWETGGSGSSPEGFSMGVAAPRGQRLSGSVAAGAGQTSPRAVRPVEGGVTQIVKRPGDLRTSPPRLIHSVQPGLTPAARAAGLRGPVVLSGTIAADGSIQDIKVRKGVEGLDQIAIEAFKQWRYEPPALDEDGKAPRITISVAFLFRDKEDESYN